MSAAAVPNPFEYNLTYEAFAAMVPQRRPPIPGDSWWIRFQVLNNDGTPADLTLVDNVTSIDFYLRPRLDQDTPSFTRSTGTARTGISPAAPQIALDVQTSEVLDDDGVSKSGTGWLTIYLDPGDKAALLLCVGTCAYALRVTWASGQEETVLAGRLELRRSAKR